MKATPLSCAFWGKSPGKTHPAHQLLAHLIDVAACVLAILEREPPATRAQIVKDFGLPEKIALRWLALLCALHDVGKATPAFANGRGYPHGDIQMQEAGLIRRPQGRPDDPLPHGAMSQGIVPDLLKSLGWPPKLAKRAADAIGAHHGFRFTNAVLARHSDPGQRGDARWQQGRVEMVDALVEALGLRGARPPTVANFSAGAFGRLAGLASVADWIGSSLEYGRDATDSLAYFDNAMTLARRRLDGLGWLQREPLIEQAMDFSELFPACNPAHPLQQHMQEMARDARGPALFLIEAPMGEGKTEAALYAYCHLQHKNGHRGLYFALPTQATGNSMFVRLREFLNRMRPGLTLDLQLLHGGAAMNTDFRAMCAAELARIQGPELARIDDDSEPDADAGAIVRAREWFTHRKRALLSEYGVGTVDQALMAVLNVKHYFVRQWGLANRVVVIDEVHAYDAYTSGLIALLVSWLRELGSSVILMSATLPKPTRDLLLQAWGATEVPECDYPRITRVDDNPEPVARTFTTRQLATGSDRVRIAACSADLPAIAAKANELAGDGGCVLVIVNTVRRAQTLYRRLASARSDDVEVLLFHSRFPAEQRERIEVDLRQRFGRDGSRRPRAAILIATQVAEQSIDVDFDALITDLAPIDLVLQRIGRMHRHARARPAHLAHPCVWIAGLDIYPTQPPLKAHGWDRVYEPVVLLASARVLATCPPIELPAHIDTLVQAVYRDDSAFTEWLAKWPMEWRAAAAKMHKSWRKKNEEYVRTAEQMSVGDPSDETDWTNVRGQQREDSEDDPEVHRSLRPATRLGDPSLRVVVLYQQATGLSFDVAGERLLQESVELTSEAVFALFSRTLPIAHQGVVHALKDQPLPAFMTKHAMLRHLRLLTIDADGYACAYGTNPRLDPELRLDSELGLVIGTIDQ